MRLTKLFIRFYKSFNYDYLRKIQPNPKPQPSQPWDYMDEKFYPYVQIRIDREITTIVGANESGKSHLLKAIEKGVSGQDIELGDFCRYSQFRSGKQGELKFPDFGYEWSDLTPEDQKNIRSAVPNIPTTTVFDRILMFRRNKDDLKLYIPDGESKFTDYPVNSDNSAKFQDYLPHIFRIDSKVGLPETVPLQKIINFAKNLKSDPPNVVATLERQQRTELDKLLNVIAAKPPSSTPRPQLDRSEAEEDPSRAIHDVMTKSRMSEEEADQRKGEVKLAHDLICKVAKIDPKFLEELAKSSNRGEVGNNEGIITTINKALEESLNFPKWWVQDSDFKLVVSPSEYDLKFAILDKTGTKYSFRERSEGLKHFLSYYIQYRAYESHGKNPEIVLMDEPDAFLSSQAQQDLLKIFEAFSKGENGRPPVQVIYVTHSPFLLDKNHPERIRVVDKGVEDEGTRVVKDVDQNHYEPLRSAFGAFVGETTFIGNCNLMVEGLAEQILITGAATYLRSRDVSDGETLDLNHITIIPTEGASHIPYLVYLARGQGIDLPPVILLMGSDQEGNKAKQRLKEQRLKENELLNEKFILQIGDIRSGFTFDERIQVIKLEDIIPLPICVKAAQRYAEKICSASKDILDLITEVNIQAKLLECKTVFKAIEQLFNDLSEPGLYIEEVGFARNVIDTIYELEKQKKSTKEIKEFEQNFKHLFELINRCQSRAKKELKEQKISQKIDASKKEFIMDKPSSAKRGEAKNRLDAMKYILEDAKDSKESNAAKEAIQKLLEDYKLESEPSKPIDDYEQFKESLEQIKYAGRLASQKEDEDFTSTQSSELDN
jgi:predicted ATP-dependent endonuclease of OLD family